MKNKISGGFQRMVHFLVRFFKSDGMAIALWIIFWIFAFMPWTAWLIISSPFRDNDGGYGWN